MFYTRRQNGLLHVTDKASTTGNFEMTAAGSLSSSNFTSACRHSIVSTTVLKVLNVEMLSNGLRSKETLNNKTKTQGESFLFLFLSKNGI